MARKKAKTIFEQKASEKPLDSELFAEQEPSGFDEGSPASTSSEARPDSELFAVQEPSGFDKGSPAVTSSEARPDSELFAVQEPSGFGRGSPASTSSEARPDRELFVGDEDLYKLLAGSAQSPRAKDARSVIQAALLKIRKKRFATLEKVLIVSIMTIASLLVYALLTSGPQSAAGIGATPGAQQETGSAEQAPTVEPQSASDVPQAENSGGAIRQEAAPMLPQEQPLSLRTAEALFWQKDYEQASAAYRQLAQFPAEDEAEEVVRDFLRLRIALCMMGTGAYEQAHRMFAEVRKSRSPLVRVLTNYHLGRLAMHNKQYLKARMRAYQAIALIQAIDSESGWAVSLRRNCQLLAAESVTRNVFSLCDADNDLPEDLWVSADARGAYEGTDPFMSADESKLQSLLNCGLDQLRKGVFGPKIRKLQHSGAGFRWSVVCDGAPIEELLARFAANAGLHIRWSSGGAPSSGQTQDIVRTRPASIYMASTTAPQFVTAAAGSVGLLSRADDKGTVEICDPASYESLSEHIALLGHEALSLWQKFTLTFHDDKYIPNAHFAIGLLHAQRNNVTDAIAEYKLVANRFPQTSLAPLALLHSSKLRTGLNDHLGARDVLKQLVEQYPDSEVHGQACLYLADVTTKAGFPNEGGGLYQKVYNLCFSPESQVTAALGAARCYFRAEDYEVAAKWLTRYIGLVKDHTNCELYSAYMLLGKAQLALGNPEQASEALECALKGQLTKEEYTETISALVDVHMQQEQLVEALDILERVRSWEMSPKEYVEILLVSKRST
jgi:tetratricopeptide (TPR) repeat protein